MKRMTGGPRKKVTILRKMFALARFGGGRAGEPGDRDRRAADALRARRRRLPPHRRYAEARRLVAAGLEPLEIARRTCLSLDAVVLLQQAPPEARPTFGSRSRRSGSPLATNASFAAALRDGRVDDDETGAAMTESTGSGVSAGPADSADNGTFFRILAARTAS